MKSWKQLPKGVVIICRHCGKQFECFGTIRHGFAGCSVTHLGNVGYRGCSCPDCNTLSYRTCVRRKIND